MVYVTLEVDIDHGKVVPRVPAKLPQQGHGLLTIIEPAGENTESMSQLEALEQLQKHLQCDERKAAEWMAAVNDARR